MAQGESAENPTMTIVESPRPLAEPETRKKEPLTDEELGNLLAAFGNNEAKAVTLIAMRKGVIYSEYDLYSAVIEKQGEGVGWRQSRGVPFAYCRSSFENIGLVAKSVSDPVLETWGYLKTDYGEELGDALAGLLLDFSLRHPEVSLYDIFGSTASRGEKKEVESSLGLISFKNRAPFTRLKIIWELATANRSIREIDLSNNIREAKITNIHQHLLGLKSVGLIHFEDIDGREAYSQFQLALNSPIESPRPMPKYPGMTKFLYELLKSDPNKIWTLEELNIAYKAKNKAENPDFVNGINNTHISSVLSFLEKAGYVYQPGSFTGEKRSILWVDEGQRLMFIDLLTLIDQFQNQDANTLQKWRMLAGNFSSWQINALMAKAKEHSSMANAVSTAETAGRILDTLKEHPKSTSREIRELILNYRERKMSKASINGILRKLKSTGKIEETVEKSIKKWSLASEPESELIS